MGRPPLDPAGTTAAAVAAARSNPEILRATDNIGSVLLHWISLRGEAELAKIVIFELGAAVDPLTSAGQTPLHWAASKGHVDVMCVLLDAGANIDAKDVSGSTPLIVAVQHTQFLALLLLLDRGASLIAADARGCSAVHWAAYKGDASALHALHRRGADLGAIDDDGLTPLHRAARGGSTETARYLIERGGQDVRTTVVVKRAAARAVGASPPSSSSTTAADQVSPSSTAAHNGSSGKAPPQATTTADGDGTNRETGGRGVVRARLGAAVPAETSTSSHAKVSAVPSAAAAISSSRALSSTGSVSSLAARTQSLARSLVSSSSSSSPLSSRTSGALQPHNKQTPSSAAAEVVTVHDGDVTGEDAVQAAEDALRIMASSSAAAGGMFNNAQAQQVLLRQRACVMYLRAQRAAALDEGLDFAVVDRTHRGSSTSTSSSLKCCKWAGVRASLRRVIWRVFSPQGIRWVLRPAIAWLFLFAVPLTVLMWQLWSVVPPAEPTDSVFIAQADELLGSSTVRTLTHWAPVLPFLLVMVLWGGGRGWLRAVPLDPYGLLGSGSSSSRSSSSGNSEPCITSAASVLCRASGTVVSPPGFKSSRLVSRAALTGAVQSAAAGSAAVAGASSLASNGSHVDALFSDMDHDISSITAALGTDIALCPAVTGSPEAPSASLLNPRVAVTRRVCTYCELLQPPRSFHDHDTDRCYEAYEGVFPLSGAPVATSNRRFNSIVIVTLWTALAVATGVMYSYTPNTITPEDEQSVPSRVWDMMWHAPPLPCLLALLVLSRGILARVSLWAANFTAWEWASKSSLPHMVGRYFCHVLMCAFI